MKFSTHFTKPSVLSARDRVLEKKHNLLTTCLMTISPKKDSIEPTMTIYSGLKYLPSIKLSKIGPSIINYPAYNMPKISYFFNIEVLSQY